MCTANVLHDPTAYHAAEDRERGEQDRNGSCLALRATDRHCFTDRASQRGLRQLRLGSHYPRCPELFVVGIQHGVGVIAVVRLLP